MAQVDLATHYNIVYDPDQVIEFAKLFTPKSSQQIMMVYLFARRKYTAYLNKPQYILEKIIVNGNNSNNEEVVDGQRLLRKLYRLHVPYGSYVDSENNAIPDESLAVYALLHPKDPIKAMNKTLTRCINDLLDRKEITRPHNMYRGELCKADVSLTRYEKLAVIDLDTKEPEKLLKTKWLLIEANVTPHIELCIETKNGFHIIYHKHKEIDAKRLYEFKKETIFYKENTKDYWFSIMSDPMTVIPGTLQGNFKVKVCNDIFL